MIKIIDSIMGSGKTNWAIQYMNEHPEKRYIFISPLLTEVQRIKDNCLGFAEPEEYTEFGEKCLKLESFHRLLQQGKNIASTHSLFKLTTKETLKYLQKWHYTLFIDEVLQVVETDSIKATDLNDLLNLKYAKIDPVTRYLIWTNDQYTGDSFRKIMIMSKTKSIYVMGEGKEKQTLIWVFPALIFNYFVDVWVMTYLFDWQPLRYYFDINSITYTKYKVNHGGIVPHGGFVDDTSKYRDLFIIYKGKKNDIGTVKDDKHPKKLPYFHLCSKWYDNATDDDFKRLRLNIYGYFFNDLNSPSQSNMWTCIKGNKDSKGKCKVQTKLEGKGYKKGFLACNARATNDYRHKTALAYPINVFLNPVIIKFFAANGIKIGKLEEEQYALSEMLQWLWRSALRDNKKVNLYIPSCRMRGILKRYLGIPKESN